MKLPFSLAYKPYFFQPTNNIFLSQQISQQYFQPWLISQANRAEINLFEEEQQSKQKWQESLMPQEL